MEINRMPQTGQVRKTFAGQKMQAGMDKTSAKAEYQPFSEMQTASAETLHLSGELPGTKQLDLYEPGQNDGIDWDQVAWRLSGSISLENADSVMRHVNSTVSVYVATKAQLEEYYAGQEEVLAEKLGKLNNMFEQSKQRIVRSYQQSVGNFYEKLGNKGIKKNMGESLSAVIDQRVKDMEAMVQEGRFAAAKENSYQLLEIALDVSSLEEERAGTIFQASGEEETEYYSLNDLQAAGTAAKEASAIKSKNPNLISDEELELWTNLQRRKIAELLSHLGAGEKMSDIIRQSIGIFTEQLFHGAGNKKSGNADTHARNSFSVYA